MNTGIEKTSYEKRDLKYSYAELIKKKIARQIYLIFHLDNGKKLQAREIKQRIKKEFGISYEKKRILRYLRRMNHFNIVKRVNRPGNRTFWKLMSDPIPLEILLAERDKEVIDSLSQSPDLIKSDYNVTIYGFPKDFLDEDTIPEFNEILDKIKNASDEMRKLVSKICIRKAISSISNKLDSEIILIYLLQFFDPNREEPMNKWYEPPYFPKYIKPDRELTNLFTRFYPSKKDGKIIEMLGNHKVSEEASTEILKCIYLACIIIPLMKLTIVAHAPSAIDSIYDQLFIKEWRKELEPSNLLTNSIDKLEKLSKKDLEDKINRLRELSPKSTEELVKQLIEKYKDKIIRRKKND